MGAISKGLEGSMHARANARACAHGVCIPSPQLSCDVTAITIGVRVRAGSQGGRGKEVEVRAHSGARGHGLGFHVFTPVFLRPTRYTM